jgi:hypothetical protein
MIRPLGRMRCTQPSKPTDPGLLGSVTLFEVWSSARVYVGTQRLACVLGTHNILKSVHFQAKICACACCAPHALSGDAGENSEEDYRFSNYNQSAGLELFRAMTVLYSQNMS